MSDSLLIGLLLLMGGLLLPCLMNGPIPKREYKPSPWHFGVGRHIVAYKEGKGYYRVDTEGITVHLCKFSDEKEEFDKNLAHISGFRIPSQKDLRDGVY